MRIQRKNILKSMVMKTLKTTLFFSLFLFVLPALASDVSKKELRKEKKRLTQKIRAEKDSQKENQTVFRGKWR